MLLVQHCICASPLLPAGTVSAVDQNPVSTWTGSGVIGDDDARKYLWTSEIPDVPVVDHYFKNEELVLLQYGDASPKNLLAAHLEIDRTRHAYGPLLLRNQQVPRHPL